MRTPNATCCICNNKMYRRPSELIKFKFVSCLLCRGAASKKFYLETMLDNLKKGSGWNKGKSLENGDTLLYAKPKSEKSKQAVSIKNKNFWKMYPEKAKERGAKCSGSKHYNWKNSVSSLHAKIRTCATFIKWSMEVKKRDICCVACGSKKEIEAHHIYPVKKLITDHEIKSHHQIASIKDFSDLKNGITLCKLCHFKEHSRNYANII